MSALTTLTLWGEYTQQAVVTAANGSFLTPVATTTDSVTGIRLGLLLGSALSGARLLVSGPSGVDDVNVLNVGDAEANATLVDMAAVTVV